MTFLNNRQFRYAVFYPSDLLQWVSNSKISMLLSGSNIWVVVVFFNGENVMHQKIWTTVRDIEAFLTSIGCKSHEGQTIAPSMTTNLILHPAIEGTPMGAENLEEVDMNT